MVQRGIVRDDGRSKTCHTKLYLRRSVAFFLTGVWTKALNTCGIRWVGVLHTLQPRTHCMYMWSTFESTPPEGLELPCCGELSRSNSC